MLPGFRFLFAAIMLSMSLLIFGLGAAALLRAAHESFASNPSWRAAPEVTFAQRPEATPPVLATLRVDTTMIDKAAIDRAVEPTKDTAKDPVMIGAALADQPPSSAETATAGEVVTLKPTETPAAEAAKRDDAPADMPAAENPPAPEATAETAVETKMAAVAAPDISPATSEPAIPPSTNLTTAAAAVSAETNGVATKIATLGGPPVDITDAVMDLESRTARSDRAKSDPNVIRKRVQGRRSIRRRRLAARARLLAAQQLQLLQANPFAQPLAAPATPR